LILPELVRILSSAGVAALAVGELLLVRSGGYWKPAVGSSGEEEARCWGG